LESILKFCPNFIGNYDGNVNSESDLVEKLSLRIIDIFVQTYKYLIRYSIPIEIPVER